MNELQMFRKLHLNTIAIAVRTNQTEAQVYNKMRRQRNDERVVRKAKPEGPKLRPYAGREIMSHPEWERF